MKHLRIKNKFRFTLSMCIIFVFIISIFNAITSKTFSYQIPQYEYIIVSQGDTLWSLASSLDGNIHKNIYEIQKINQLDDCSIYIGQTLKIPIQ